MSGSKAVMFDGIKFSFDSTPEVHTECHILGFYFLLCGVI